MIDFTILVLPGAFPSSVVPTPDIFRPPLPLFTLFALKKTVWPLRTILFDLMI